MPLPHFLALLVIVLIAGAVTLWLLASSGVPVAYVALGALIGAGVMRLMTRVE
jgi:multisubunit Na+/H+ antiporter MnhE subunit